MGGEGTRCRQDVPKQFYCLQGKPLYRYALDTFLKLGVCDEIIGVCHGDWIERMEKIPGVRWVKGGATRQESSRLGLQGLQESPHIVIIHDAVRPFVTEEIILTNLESAITWGAVDTCIPSADTLVFAPQGKWIESIPQREKFLRGQTPQTFHYNLILEVHEWAQKKGIQNASDDCRLVIECGKQVAIVQGNEENFKVTSPFDLRLIEAFLSISDKSSTFCTQLKEQTLEPQA